MELRAIFKVVPDEFNLDASGEKKRWREQLVKTLEGMSARDENGSLPLPQSRARAYFYKTPEAMEAERMIYKERAERLLLAKAELTKLTRETTEAKRDLDVAMATWRDPQNKSRKEELKKSKDALKVVHDAKKKQTKKQEEKVNVTTKQCARDKIARAELDHEARRIKL